MNRPSGAKTVVDAKHREPHTVVAGMDTPRERRHVAPFLAASALCAVLAVARAACNVLPAAAADTVSQTRPTAAFDRVRLTGVFTTTIVAGASRTHVTITGNPKDLAFVTSEVDHGTLELGIKEHAHDIDSIAIAIEVPALHGFTDTGVGTTTISGLTGGDIDLEIPGAASLVAKGRAAHETITLDGAGKIDATDVYAQDADVTSNGVGGIYVRATGTLSMTVNGVGEIRYAGNPASVESHVNGVGRIAKM
jgi:hypothetical protein